MTWIRTIPFEDDETLRKRARSAAALYPIEYAEPTHPQHKARPRDRRVTLADPRRAVPRLRRVRRADVAGPAADAGGSTR